MAERPQADVQGGLTEEEKRANVLRLVFGGDQERFTEFCRVIRQA